MHVHGCVAFQNIFCFSKLSTQKNAFLSKKTHSPIMFILNKKCENMKIFLVKNKKYYHGKKTLCILVVALIPVGKMGNSNDKNILMM